MRIRTTDDWVSIIHGDITGHFLVEHESESLILDSSTADTENNVLIEATDLYDQLLAGDVSVNFVCENTILTEFSMPLRHTSNHWKIFGQQFSGSSIVK